MLTKTFRAQNMLLALKNVQAELGPDAMIISMREVPSGPIWAAWKKPGVEVIASKAANASVKNEHAVETDPQASESYEKTTKPSSDELKQEIENLKKLVLGHRIETSPEIKKKASDNHSRPATRKSDPENHGFDISDFKQLREYKEPQFTTLTEKTEKLIANSKPVRVEKNPEPVLPTKLLDIKQKLIDQGINIELVNKIIDTNLDALSPSALNDLSRLDRFIKHQLTVCLPPSRKSLALVPSRVMAVVGPSGCGKSSCCAKLASFYMITMGKKVVWIEADTTKTSAISEARTYTETLGIPLFLAYTPQELTELLDSQKDADLILIDTASCNPRNEDSVTEMGSYISTLPAGSTYLVAAATTKEQDLIQIEKTYRPFGIKGIILTKTDETGIFGASFNLLWKSKLPLYFFTTGTQIFGNLKPGNPEQLVDAIVAGEFPRE